MALRTYGDKPISFQVEENGEYYCIGSEVRNIFGTQLTLLAQEQLLDFCYDFRLAITCDYFAGLCTKGILECFAGQSQTTKGNV